MKQEGRLTTTGEPNPQPYEHAIATYALGEASTFCKQLGINIPNLMDVTLKAGQFIIFAERCIHGSAPNNTDRHRIAFNLRAVPTNVAVYPNKKYYRSVYNGGKYFLDKWGVCLLRGVDEHQLSRTVPPELLDRGGPQAATMRQAA